MNQPFLSHFTPSLMAPETLEAIFVQREAVVQDLIDRIGESAMTPAKHHALVLGSRGIGKTHLVSMIYYRVQSEGWRDRLLVAWLREEEWGVTSFLDLLIRIFRALEEDDATIADRVEPLYELSQDAAQSAGAKLLRDIIGDRTLLLLIENLDDLFNGLGEPGQKQLRSFLQENACCTIVATAQRLFNGVTQRTAPFFGFFRRVELKKLSLDDATLLLRKIAHLRGDRELEQFIQTPTGRSRIQAVQHLSGGSPRIYVILAEFLSRESLDKLVPPFMSMLDALTPYYQSRMMSLPPQQRKIVEFLCDRRNAIPVKEIAQRSFITHQTASSQLKDLRDKGYVQAFPVGRESYYELCEPLMRLCIEVKKSRGKPIQLFIDFLRLWYAPTELKQRLQALPPTAELERQYLLRALEPDDREDPRLNSYLEAFKKHFDQGKFVQSLEDAENLILLRGCSLDWFIKASCLFKLELYSEALDACNKAIDLDPEDVRPLIVKASILLSKGCSEEVLEVCKKAIELQPNAAFFWRMQGSVLVQLERWEDALSLFEKAIELNPSDSSIRSFQTTLLKYLKHCESELEVAKQAIQDGDQSWHSFANQAIALMKLGKQNESLISLEKAFLYLQSGGAERMVKDTIRLLQLLLIASINSSAWQPKIQALIELYDKHDTIHALVQALMQSIRKLPNTDKANQWHQVWKNLVGDRAEFQLPLRLLDAAVRYQKTPDDPRILLGLAIEERKLLKDVLGLEDALMGDD